MTDWEDYYEILGVTPDSSDQEIKEAYRYKVNILHPDRLVNVPEFARRRAEQDLKKVNRAYDVLKDPQRKREYYWEWARRNAGPQNGSVPPKTTTSDSTTRNVTWFEKHLNWTWVFAYFIWAILNAVRHPVIQIIGVVFLLLISGWVIKKKARSLWWLLLTPIFAPLWLPNKQEQPIL